ncbi:hypothetical protein RFF05_06290 [Bengtsoniella intestinalis]
MKNKIELHALRAQVEKSLRTLFDSHDGEHLPPFALALRGGRGQLSVGAR